MERKALVSAGGGGLLRSTGSRRRSRSRGRPESTGVQSWKMRLSLVHNLVKQMNLDGIAPRLYQNVASHLHDTITKLDRLDTTDRAQWGELVDLLVVSRDFYADKADTLSFLTIEQSPYHLFEAIATGMEFEDSEARELNNSADRELWLGRLLGNIGKEIGLLVKHPKYFDQVISKGSGSLFMKIAHVLQGANEHGKVSIDGGVYDWRTALVKVMDKIKQIKRPENVVGFIYDQVLAKLDIAIKKITLEQDLHNKDYWDMVYDTLREKMISFDTLSFFPSVERLFKALESGLRIIGKKVEWRQINSSEREAVMEKVLKNLGSKLKELPGDYYDGFLPHGGADRMAEVAEILTNVGNGNGKNSSFYN
jgi:hypothetical protein